MCTLVDLSPLNDYLIPSSWVARIVGGGWEQHEPSLTTRILNPREGNLFSLIYPITFWRKIIIINHKSKMHEEYTLQNAMWIPLLGTVNRLFTQLFFLFSFSLTFIEPSYRPICWGRVVSKDGESNWETRREWVALIKFGQNIYYSPHTF